MEHVDDRRLCCGTPPGNSYNTMSHKIFSLSLQKGRVWGLCFSWIRVLVYAESSFGQIDVIMRSSMTEHVNLIYDITIPASRVENYC